MRQSLILVSLLLILVNVSAVIAADPPLYAAAGTVVKANANAVIIRPHGADGKAGKAIVLKLKGTSTVSILSTRLRDGQTIPVQREMEAKDLLPDQGLAFIYTTVNDENVLLSAVALPVVK